MHFAHKGIEKRRLATSNSTNDHHELAMGNPNIDAREKEPASRLVLNEKGTHQAAVRDVSLLGFVIPSEVSIGHLEGILRILIDLGLPAKLISKKEGSDTTDG